MGFHEIQFPVDISWGSRGGPGYNTSIVEVDSGAEERIARWSNARRQYDAAYGVKSQATMASLIDFYMGRQGAAHGFRYKDWSDYTSASDHVSAVDDEDHQIGIGDNSETDFQLVKIYDDGLIQRTRNITKPVSGTTIIAIDGAAQAAGWTVSTVTGVVTFAAAPALNAVVTAGFQFDVPCRFGEELDAVLDVNLDAFDSLSVGAVPIIEIIDEDGPDEEFYYGGGSHHAISANYQLSLGEGRTQSFNTSTASLTLKLPDPDTLNLPMGGPYFYLQNISTTQDMSIVDHDDAAMTPGTLTKDNGTMIVFLGDDGLGNKSWYAMGG